MRNLNKIIVVGASLAGLRAVQTLRRQGFDGEITLVGAENHVPYNRPPLSKGMLRGDEDVTLPGAEDLGDQWLRGKRAVKLDALNRTVTLDDGARLGYQGLIIATGARPRRLGGVRTLRTLDDALALRAELASGHEHVLVIGGGFIGGEIASTARRLGRKVTLVDSSPHPMHGTLGQETARWLAAHHERHGVELITDARVTDVAGGHVRLSDGRRFTANLVVGGMGVTPNTEWLSGSGLATDDGVLCEATLFARGSADVVAAGDVARWPHGLYGGALVRVEHWSNANEQGAVAAHNLLAGPESAEPFMEVPAFATTVHGARIQTAGLPHLADAARLTTGSPDEDCFAVAFTRRGVLVGAVAVNSPKELIKLKKAIKARESA